MSILKVKKKIFVPSILLLFIIGTIILIVIFNNKSVKNLFIVFNFLLIALLSTFAILKDSRIISINKVIWYFCLIFMSVAPLCQYLSGYYPWQFFVKDSEIEYAQFITLIFYIIYYVFYNFAENKVRLKHRRQTGESAITDYLYKTRDFSAYAQLLLFTCVLFAFVLLIRLVGFKNLFIKSENSVEIENSTIRFVVNKFLSAFPAMACTIFLLYKKRNFSWVIISITFVITLLSNFPTSTTRYWMATILLGLILVRYMRRVESRKLDYAILVAVVVFFPFFYIFKTNTLEDMFDGWYAYKGIIDSFNTVDFDAFTLLSRAVRYVSDNGVTMGRQLLNIILFFVPRSLWPGKPITTNTLIASSQGAKFTNLSCPLPAEGYVNFGIVGVVLYACIVAAYARYLDGIYWKKSFNTTNNIITMIYPYLTIIVLYMSRGPLQPSFIQTIALILPMILIVGIFSNKNSKEV